MKFLAILAATPLALGAVMPREALNPEKLPEGRYISTIHEDGTEKTTFVPLEHINNKDFTPIVVDLPSNSTSLARRETDALDKRDGCEDFGLNDGDVDRAGDCVLGAFGLDPISLVTHQKVWCDVGNARTYICSYNAGQNSKFNIKFEWGWIRSTLCGPGRSGFAHLPGGSGNWDVGYKHNGVGICAF